MMMSRAVAQFIYANKIVLAPDWLRLTMLFSRVTSLRMLIKLGNSKLLVTQKPDPVS